MLPALRARFAAPRFGVVHAVRGCRHALGRHARVLAARAGVVARYTRGLVSTYAGGCDVTLVGATGLAAWPRPP